MRKLRGVEALNRRILTCQPVVESQRIKMDAPGDITGFSRQQARFQYDKGDRTFGLMTAPGVAPVCASSPEGMSIETTGAGWAFARSINVDSGSRGA